MAENRDHPRREDALNPALKKRKETTHDTDRRTPSPADSASVQREEGKPWPWIWLAVTILGVLLAIYLIFF
jgi:hypothetical protein